jgi:hypothetical protein
MPLDGFRVPSSPSFTVADSVEVLVEDRLVSADLADALVGSVGVAVVQFRFPEDLSLSTPSVVVIRTGGVLSNALPVPLKSLR